MYMYMYGVLHAVETCDLLSIEHSLKHSRPASGPFASPLEILERMALVKLPDNEIVGRVCGLLGATCASEMETASERGLTPAQTEALRGYLEDLQSTVAAEIQHCTTVRWHGHRLLSITICCVLSWY